MKIEAGQIWKVGNSLIVITSVFSRIWFNFVDAGSFSKYDLDVSFPKFKAMIESGEAILIQ